MATATIVFGNERRLSHSARRSWPGASVTSHFPRAMTLLALLGSIAAAPGRSLRGTTTHSFCTPTGAVCITADHGTIGRSEWFRLSRALGLVEARSALAAEGLAVAE